MLPQLARNGRQVHVLDAGHFALDTKADEIATVVREFIAPQKYEPVANRSTG